MGGSQRGYQQSAICSTSSMEFSTEKQISKSRDQSIATDFERTTECAIYVTV
jgi:hypothetical protein